MTIPTKEQIAAAKAWTRSTPDSPITAEQHAALVAYAEANKGTPGLWQWSDAPSHILLAALEAAEADSARLLESLEWAVLQLDCEDGTELENGGDFLHRDTAGYKQCKAALDAARKAQP